MYRQTRGRRSYLIKGEKGAAFASTINTRHTHRESRHLPETGAEGTKACAIKGRATATKQVVFILISEGRKGKQTSPVLCVYVCVRRVMM